MSLSSAEISTLVDFLDYHDPQILDRGYKLFLEGGVRFLDYEKGSQTYLFKVKGNLTSSYEVSICLFEDDEYFEFDEYDEFEDFEPDNLSCECVYFEENDCCKHTAAAIHFLLAKKESDLSTKIIPLFPQESPKSVLPIEISCELKDILNLAESIPFQNQSNIRADLVNLHFLENGLGYDLRGMDFSGRFYVIYKEGKVIISSEDRRDFIQKRALTWFKVRYASEKKKELNFLTESLRKQFKINQLESMGLTDFVKDPENALRLVFSRGEILLIPDGELVGFRDLSRLPVDIESYLVDVSANTAETVLENLMSENEAGLYNVGFGLVFDYHKFHTVVPFMAKGTKKNPESFSVKFTSIEDPEDIKLRETKNLSSLLSITNNLNKISQKNHSKSTFRLFKEFLATAEGYPIFNFVPDHFYQKDIRKSNVKNELQPHLAKIKLNISKTGPLYTSNFVVYFKDEKFDLLDAVTSESILFTDIFLIYQEKHLLYTENFESIDALKHFKDIPKIQFLEGQKDEFVNKILLKLSKSMEIHDESGLTKEATVDQPPLRSLYISELNGLILFRPEVRYGEGAFSNPLETGSVLDPISRTIYLRNEELEREFVQVLRDLHPKFKNAGVQGFFHLNQDTFMEGLWFLGAFETLKTHQIKVFGLENLKIKKYSPFPPIIGMDFGSSQDWFEVNVSVAFGDETVKLKDIKKAIERNEDFVELGDGSIGILPEKWLRKFKKLLRTANLDKEELKIAKTHFQVLEELEEASLFPKILQEITEKKERLKAFQGITNTTVPSSLKANLRNYQQIGLNWLGFLKEYQWGGVLADDMGLGKTLQMIAFICKIIEENPKAKILVVAPTTLLFNWRDEIEKFAPDLDFFIHHGNRYNSSEELLKHQVLLTSYGLVINDLALLSEIEFDLLIADESQAIKNPISLRFKSITKLKAKLRIAMSGTPIENGLTELFAQMSFVNPGFFLTLKNFKDNYLTPLKNGDKEALMELQKKIKPFVLRRTKEEVLTELPEKMEEYLYCIMGDSQRKIYDAYRNEYRDYMMKKIEEEGPENSKMYLLEGLTKLRQVCDSTKLVKHTEKSNASIKTDILIEHILEKTGNHKILIFSQFVKMLEIVKEKLEEYQIPYAYLDGKSSMKAREKSVTEFQNDESKRVFLISLKAGGTGLNLTAADYVYILDPWWNPATENQAIDRCYRMGQKKNVVAYRMICKDTVEEKIMNLQQVKIKLAKDIISDGDGFLASLDKEAMLGLFD